MSILYRKYTITWQPPAGWVQTSISANGNAVSFTPDATSAGPLTATIHNTVFDEIKIYDKEGNLKKYQKFGKVKAATINIASLTSGVYFIEIGNGAFKERKQLLVQK